MIKEKTQQRVVEAQVQLEVAHREVVSLVCLSVSRSARAYLCLCLCLPLCLCLCLCLLPVPLP